VREEILAAAFRGDEAEALGIVEPLDRTGRHVLIPLYKLRKSGNARITQARQVDQTGTEQGRRDSGGTRAVPCVLLVLNLQKQVGVYPLVTALPAKGYRIPNGARLPSLGGDFAS
jgi:hypothetical protein